MSKDRPQCPQYPACHLGEKEKEEKKFLMSSHLRKQQIPPRFVHRRRRRTYSYSMILQRDAGRLSRGLLCFVHSTRHVTSKKKQTESCRKSRTRRTRRTYSLECVLLLEYVLLLSPPHVAQGAHTACLPGLFPIARLDAKRNRKKKQITFLQGVYSLVPKRKEKREKSHSS